MSITLRRKVHQKVSVMRKTKTQHVVGSYAINSARLADDIAKMIELGGILSGGGAISCILGNKTKDLDFYFNNEESYIEAYNLTNGNPSIDVCWFFNDPHELHDIAFVMCNIYPDGSVEITPQAMLAMNSSVSDIYVENIIFPNRTIARMHKYNRKYGLKYKKHQVLSLCMFPTVNDDDIASLIEISV